MTGTEIGNYRILEKLGEGGMGVVYKAVDVNLERTVAIKALNTQLTGNPELEQRFRAEARAQANLNHTNLATLYALVIEDGKPWMVMEYIEGETFDHMVQRRGPIPALEAIPLFRQSLLGIGYAHRMGIIHRDIKPSNMMLNQQGIVKVMDFGIAKVLGARGMTRTGTQMGTAFYMAPEQVLNKGVDIRSDIYSLGVTLYEMLTANVPFGGDSDYQIMTDHVNKPPPLPTKFYPYIPAGVQNAVLKALEKSPDARFQTVEEFGAALEHPETFGVDAAAVPVVVGAPIVAAAAAPPARAAGAGAVPVLAAAVAAPPKSSFWNQEKKIIAGGLGLALLMVGAWAALRPHPKNNGVPLPPAGGNSGISIPSSDATLKVLKEGGPPPLPNNSGGKDGNNSGGSGNPKDSSGRDVAPPVAGLTIPAGTPVMIRMIDSIDTSRDRAGQRFAASIDSPVVVRGRVVIARGANARVLLASSSQAGHIEGRSAVSLQLISVSIHGVSYPVRSSSYVKQGASRGKRSAVVIGGGAAVGAAIGGIFGRKRGAAEGAAAGAGAGTGAQLLTKAEPVTIPSETRIDFILHSPIVLAR
ncbi:MAG TPA: serine/threonine-protein kinase [Bryobacteraceae bacterium]